MRMLSVFSKKFTNPCKEVKMPKNEKSSEIEMIGEYKGLKIYFDPHANSANSMLFPRKQGDQGNLSAVIVGIRDFDRIHHGIDSYISLHLGKKLGIL